MINARASVNYLRPEENHLKLLEETICSSHRAVPIGVGNLIIHRALGRVLRIVLPQQQGKISFTSNAVLINKILLQSTGNYIQYLVINHNGKECEKEKIHTYIYIHTYTLTESLCCTPETNTTL